MKPTLFGFLSLGGVIVVWSSWAIASRWGLLHSPLAPTDLMFLRFGFAAIVMLPVLIHRGTGPANWKSCLWLALTAGPGYAAFTYTGLVYAPAAHGAALTAGMLPLFTIVIGAVAGVVQITRVRIIGLMLMGFATLMFFLDGNDAANPRAWMGDLLLLGGPLVWSFYTLRVQSLKLDAIRATAIVSVFGFLIFAPIYLAIGEPEHLIKAGLMSSFLQGVFHGWIVVVGSLTLFTHAVRTLGPAVTTLATATVPAIVAVAATILLSEPFTRWTAAGVGFDAAGLLCVSIALMRVAKKDAAEQSSAHRPT